MCHAARAPLYCLGRDVRFRKTADHSFSYTGLHHRLKKLRSSLIGTHQIRNAALAIAAAELLVAKGYAAQPAHIREGIARAQWPGRMEILQRRPTVLIDGAHNPEGWRILQKMIPDYFTFKRLFLVLGVMQDKDIGAMLKILTPGAYATILCRPAMSRAASREIFSDFIRFSGRKKVFWHNTSSAALRHALALAAPEDLICAAGSLFLAGELRELYKENTIRTSGRIRL
jgi:dihydrofolate synthase/folylpolyglutamate synthase